MLDMKIARDCKPGDSAVTAMVLRISNYDSSRLDSAPKQRVFISRRAQAFKEFAEDILLVPC